LPWHITGVVLMQATGFGVQFALPVLAIKHFGASEWQTLIMTAAPTVFFTLSIFWNDLFSRLRLGKYLLLYWTVACLPMALAGVREELWLLIACHLLACVGGAGWHPAAGDLLRSLYPPERRGRVYGVLWGCVLAVGALSGYAIGRLLKADASVYRVLLPVVVVMQLGGVGVLTWLGRATWYDGSRTLRTDTRSLYERAVEPVLHMKEVLRGDRTFFRYEAAYMTYGVGWMICTALLPFLVTDKLGLDYDQIAQSTHVAYYVAMLAMMVPAGIMLDRLGAVRTTALSFTLLALHPLGLIVARGEASLAVASVLFGVAHTGASMGWMLGPVSLAPGPERVPQYVAIHATLVGVRGKLFQGLGVGVYWLLRELDCTVAVSLAVPLACAAGAYLWSGWQMRQLHRMMKK
jgi:hypothetical protein